MIRFLSYRNAGGAGQGDVMTSGDHLAMMTSMSGFKFAVSFLFNSATEAMATATRRAREVTVLSIL